MATYVSHNGQPHLVNLDNTDFIRRKNGSAVFEIEFYKSERTSKEQKPTYIVAWSFTSAAERDAVIDQLLREHGSTLMMENSPKWNASK